MIASSLYFSGNACSFLKELTLWFYEGFGIWNAVKENAKCHLSWIHSLPYCSSDKQRSHNSSQMIKGDPLCRKSLRWRIKSLLGSASYTAGLCEERLEALQCWRWPVEQTLGKLPLCVTGRSISQPIAARFSRAYRNIFMLPGML